MSPLPVGRCRPLSAYGLALLGQSRQREVGAPLRKQGLFGGPGFDITKSVGSWNPIYIHDFSRPLRPQQVFFVLVLGAKMIIRKPPSWRFVVMMNLPNIGLGYPEIVTNCRSLVCNHFGVLLWQSFCFRGPCPSDMLAVITISRD